MQRALDADLERLASSNDDDMISITVRSDTDTKRICVAPAQPVHEAIAEEFGVAQQQVHRVFFGETDVLEGESFEDHGVEVSVTNSAPVCRVYLARHSSSHLDRCVCCGAPRTERGSARASKRRRRV